MVSTEMHEVHTDSAGHLYQRLHGVWTAIGAAPAYNGAELHHAHVDKDSHLCYRYQGQWTKTAGGLSAYPPEPQALSADVSGTLYAYHAGTFATVTLS